MRNLSIFLGTLFAIIAFSSAAFSLLDFLNEDLDIITTMVRSPTVVRYNFMMVFKWVITVIFGTMIGLATYFIVVFPILGYATWPAYMDILAKQAASQSQRGDLIERPCSA